MQNQSNTKEIVTPWHREPWVWFILAILLVTFIWGSIALTLAINNRDSTVVDDYYKIGKVINEDLSRENRATDLNINATITIDDMTGEVHTLVDGNLQAQPETLMLRLSSPVFQSGDRKILLRLSPNGDYIGNLDRSAEGRYYVQLETLDEQTPEHAYQTGWRINKELFLTPGAPITLSSGSSVNDYYL
ncbi:MAG: FixH family protein [Endozoicomonadaceae bacterium]|nr:FixH family protein [Endozoicomonadaceae bacterium]